MMPDRELSIVFVNKMLRVAGFEVADVIALKLNDFRTSQIEVLFAPGVEIDTQVIETKLKNGGMDVIVSKFEYMEEFLVILESIVCQKTRSHPSY